MRSFAIAWVVCAACSFRPSGGGGGAAGSDAQLGSGDAPAGSDAMVGAEMPPALCDTSDASLKLCLEFDQTNLATAATALDGSGLGHDAAIDSITVVTRTSPVSSQAVQSSSATSIRVATTTDLDVQQFTISAWVKRGGLPASSQGVIDTGLQYTLSIDNNGDVECAIAHGGQAFVLSPNAFTGTEWDLVACTYDGASWCQYSFRGTASPAKGCGGFNQSVDTGVGRGTAIGGYAQSTTQTTAHFIGSIDQVRIYNRALTQRELCVAGGISGC